MYIRVVVRWCCRLQCIMMAALISTKILPSWKTLRSTVIWSSAPTTAISMLRRLIRSEIPSIHQFSYCSFHNSWISFINPFTADPAKVFTARAYARTVLGVVILSVRLSVCLSITRVDCDKTKWPTADIAIPHERAITLLLWYQEWLVGDAPFPLKSAFEVTHPLRKTPTSTDFRS